MTKFNLKQAKKAPKPYEKLLQEENDKFDLAGDAEIPYTKLLEEDRKPEETKGDKNYEKLLDKARVGSSHIITEKQLDDGIEGSWLKTRRDDGIPLMDMHQRTSQPATEAFVKATADGEREKLFWDKFLNDQNPDGDLTKIVDNVQKSDLLSNYDSREEFLKDHAATSKGVAVTDMFKDADAILYHLYRKAAEEERELTEKEKEMVDSINKEKENILSSAIESK